MDNSADQLRHRLFLAAFILAPAIPTALAWLILWTEPAFFPAPLAFITLAIAFAPLLGLACYIVLGLPWIWYCAVRRKPSPRYLAKAAVVANTLSPAVLIIQSFIMHSTNSPIGLIIRDSFSSYQMLLIWFFGFFFAALWGALVASVYRALSSAFPLSQNPV